jgi:hypothetical protein
MAINKYWCTSVGNVKSTGNFKGETADY